MHYIPLKVRGISTFGEKIEDFKSNLDHYFGVKRNWMTIKTHNVRAKRPDLGSNCQIYDNKAAVGCNTSQHGNNSENMGPLTKWITTNWSKSTTHAVRKNDTPVHHLSSSDSVAANWEQLAIVDQRTETFTRSSLKARFWRWCGRLKQLADSQTKLNPFIYTRIIF